MDVRRASIQVGIIAVCFILGCSDAPSGDHHAHHADGGTPPADSIDESAVGGAVSEVVSGQVHAASLRDNAVVNLRHGCTGVLVAPTLVLTASHCLGAIGQPPACTAIEVDDPHWQTRGQWYPYTCSNNLNYGPGVGPTVTVGAALSRLFASEEPWGVYQRFQITGVGTTDITYGGYVALSSSNGFYMGSRLDGGGLVYVEATTASAYNDQFQVVNAQSVGLPVSYGAPFTLKNRSGGWVMILDREVLLTNTEAHASVFTLSKYGGGFGPVAHGDYVTVRSGFMYMTAEDGGGEPPTFSTGAMRYNMGGDLDDHDDIALIELADAVPAHFATPMDVVHRIPGVEFASRTKVNGDICVGTDQCRVGDFNGDGRTDLLSSDAAGVLRVATSTGTSTSSATQWSTSSVHCGSGFDCVVGDFNGDGRDDVARFQTTGGARVALSLSNNTFAYPGYWGFGMPCGTTGKTCVAGDVNGDGRDDIVIFHRSTDSSRIGDVDVAISTSTGFLAPQKYSDDFCPATNPCDVGDFNGDGRGDIVSFWGDASGNVTVGLWSMTAQSVPAFTTMVLPWATGLCTTGMTCSVGDFDGDGRSDVAGFTRSTGTSSNQKRVRVAISDRERFGPVSDWVTNTCGANDVCQVADFSGDGRSDVVVFFRSSTSGRTGDVDVAASRTGASAATFFLGDEVRGGGWGILTYVTSDRYRPAHRQEAVLEFGYQSLNNITLFFAGNGNVFKGDSGSPARWYDPHKNQWVVLGVLSTAGYNLGAGSASVPAYGEGGWDGNSTRIHIGNWYRAAIATP